jgi:hypothetical protein
MVNKAAVPSLLRRVVGQLRTSQLLAAGSAS